MLLVLFVALSRIVLEALVCVASNSDIGEHPLPSCNSSVIPRAGLLLALVRTFGRKICFPFHWLHAFVFVVADVSCPQCRCVANSGARKSTLR